MLQTDVKALRKPHSPTLEGRKYVYTNNNTIQGNRAIIGGYYYSYINLGYNPPVAQGGTRWSLPFSIYRLDLQEDDIHIAFVQINALMGDDKLPFKNELFAGIFGKNRRQVSLFQAYEAYRQRFDIEVHNRFSNQALLLDKFQSPNIEHIDNWAAIVLLTYWLLFIAAQDAEAFCFPWERYDPKYKKQIVPLITDINKTKTEPIDQLTGTESVPKNLDIDQESKSILSNSKPLMSVAQTRKTAYRLFSTFDLLPFYPKHRNNGKGRAKGQTQTKRTKHPVLKKSQVELKTRVNV